MVDPVTELGGLFASAALSSSILPGGSEVVFVYLLSQERHATGILLGVATLGNTLGAMTSWLIGRALPEKRFQRPGLKRALALTRRYGLLALLFSWLPIIGDAFCVAAGWLRIAWLPALISISAGKCARYAALWWVFEAI